MSQENAENLRAFLEAWFREPLSPDTWQGGRGVDMSLLDPEVVYEDANLPDHVGEPYRGHQGVVRAAERWIEGVGWLLVELEQIVGVGDHLVSIHRLRSKARSTGIEFDIPLFYAWTFRDGKVTHFQSYASRADALEAAGLSE